jgi:hypothetical protein
LVSNLPLGPLAAKARLIDANTNSRVNTSKMDFFIIGLLEI